MADVTQSALTGFRAAPQALGQHRMYHELACHTQSDWQHWDVCVDCSIRLSMPDARRHAMPAALTCDDCRQAEKTTRHFRNQLGCPPSVFPRLRELLGKQIML